MSPLGTTLATLRAFAGLGEDEVARRAGLHPREVRKAEKGGASSIVVSALCGLYGVDPARLVAGQIATLDSHAAVFLFSGDLSDLAQTDLPTLASALNVARAISADPEASQRLRRRLDRTPARPAGPSPAHAARQGYLLARDLRAALVLGGNAVDRFSPLLESLGIVALTASLSTPSLRAAAVLDADRAAAAIVLNGSGRDRGPAQRVAVAHEICHLVYDPIGVATCTVTLDAIAEAKGSDLLESRARGFAAEFLLPVAGLRMTLGGPRGLSSVTEAQAAIRTVCATFRTPWEIAANHLYNTGFIGMAPWTELKQGPVSRISAPDAQDEESYALPLRDSSDHAGIASLARIRARDEAIHASQGWYSEAEKLVTRSQQQSTDAPTRAGIELAKAMDEAISAGRPGLVLAVLRRIDPAAINGDAMVGVLSSVRDYCESFGSPVADAYRLQTARTLDALAHRWEWSPDDIVDAREQLA